MYDFMTVLLFVSIIVAISIYSSFFWGIWVCTFPWDIAYLLFLRYCACLFFCSTWHLAFLCLCECYFLIHRCKHLNKIYTKSQTTSLISIKLCDELNNILRLKCVNWKPNDFVLALYAIPGDKRSLRCHVSRLWFLALWAAFCCFTLPQFEVKTENYPALLHKNMDSRI